MQISLTEEQEKILLTVFERIKVRGEFSREEQLEMALDTLLNSYDTTVDAEDSQVYEGHPINAAQLKEVIDRTVNPSIETEFVQPQGSADEPEPLPTFGELLALDPENPYMLAADDDLKKAACELVFSQFPVKEWRSEQMKRLLETAANYARIAK